MVLECPISSGQWTAIFPSAQDATIGSHRSSVNPPLTGPENDDQVFPGQQMPMSGFSSVGLVANKSSPSKFHPGSPGFSDPQPIDHHPGAQANPGRKLSAFEEGLFRCLEVMAQITQQQQQIQQQLHQAFPPTAASASKNAMAAAPSYSAHPLEVKQQHFEVKTVPQYDPARCEPVQAQEPRMALKQSVTTTWQHIGCLPAAIESEGGSTRDVTSNGYDLRKLVSISERPRQRPGSNRKDSFGQQLLLKKTTSIISILVATGATRLHLQIKVICRIVAHGPWSITKSTATSTNHPSPWPPPTNELRSHGSVFNEIGGGRDSRNGFSPAKTETGPKRFVRLNRQPLKMYISSRCLQHHSVRCPSPSQPTVHVQRSACHV